MVDKISKMFITGPEVIKTVLNEEISMEDLGGARVQAEITGNAHFYAEDEQECFDQVKKLVTFIPWNNRKRADPFPVKEPSDKRVSSVERESSITRRPPGVAMVDWIESSTFVPARAAISPPPSMTLGLNPV